MAVNSSPKTRVAPQGLARGAAAVIRAAEAAVAGAGAAGVVPAAEAVAAAGAVAAAVVAGAAAVAAVDGARNPRSSGIPK